MYWFLLMWKLGVCVCVCLCLYMCVCSVCVCVCVCGRGEGRQSLSLIGSYQSIIWANQQGNQELGLRLMIAV